MITEFIQKVREQVAFFGHVSSLLSDENIATLCSNGFTVDQCYLVACDMNSGYGFAESMNANAVICFTNG